MSITVLKNRRTKSRKNEVKEMAVVHSPIAKAIPPRHDSDSGEEFTLSPRSQEEIRDWHEKILDAVSQKVQYLLSQGTSRASNFTRLKVP